MTMRIAASGADVFPETRDVIPNLTRTEQIWGDQSNAFALSFICALAKDRHPVFEIGTFRGRTTLNLALNTSGEVFTLDLGGPPAGEEQLNIANQNYGAYVPGELFLDADASVRSRIHLILGDSASVDLSSKYGKMGLVYVDAGHSYEACLRDSELAFKLVRPGGLVLWDDYGDYWPGVKRAIDEMTQTRALVHLRKENFVVFQAPMVG